MKATVLCLAALAVSLPAHASDWTVDSAHSQVHFKVGHLVVHTVEGSLGEVTGTLHLDDEPARSSVHAAVDLTRIDTGSTKRDAHLRTADFFDVPNHPRATFSSTRVTRLSSALWRVEGTLEVRGVARPLTLEVHLDPPTGRLAADATVVINRHDFHIDYGVGAMVASEATVQLHVEAVPAAAVP